MKILVCLKEIVDPALSLDNGLQHALVFREGLPRRLNPPDIAALAIALDLKTANKDPEIIAVSIGGAEVESYLRNALAIGADKAARIWDESLTKITPYQKALLLSAFTSQIKADVVLTGARSLDTGSGQVGAMLAARLGFSFVNDVVNLEIQAEQSGIICVKDLGRGEREKLSCPLPAVVAVKGDRQSPYASLDKLVESRTAVISLLSAADLQIPPFGLQNSPVKVTELSFPRPPLVKPPPLDSSLPAFYRILQLLTGGIAKRKGTILAGAPDALAEQLYQLFLKEGVIKKSHPDPRA